MSSKTEPIRLVVFVLVVFCLGACAPPPVQVVRVEVTVTHTPGPSPTPVPTWTPTPVPTATPIPPAHVEALVPDGVSPLEPVTLGALFVPPEGVAVEARLSATVMDPAAEVYATFELSEREGSRYLAAAPLQLPLAPLPGYWWLIVHTEMQVPVMGDPARFFKIEPVVFRELTGTLPSGVTIRMPLAFDEVLAQGDRRAGGRIWRHRDGEVALWWSPGPTEDLLLSNALVALESTYAADERETAAPTPTEVFETTWQDRQAFEFPENWPGGDGGPGVAWVIQGEDEWLYILRVRATGGDAIPLLHLQVAETFGFLPLDG